jgi:hypothetical protein
LSFKEVEGVALAVWWVGERRGAVEGAVENSEAVSEFAVSAPSISALVEGLENEGI